MNALITRSSCDRCDRAGREGDTGAFVCMLYGDADSCPTWQAVSTELVGEALQAVAGYATRLHHTPAEVKAEAIEADAGKFEAWAEALGATFDVAEFARRCGERAGVAA